MSIITLSSQPTYYQTEHVRSKRCGEIRMSMDEMHFHMICDYCGIVCNDMELFINHIQTLCEERDFKNSLNQKNTNKEENTSEFNMIDSLKIQNDLSNREEIPPITTIQEETTSELELLNITNSKESIRQLEVDEREKLLTFIDTIANYPTLWNPKYWHDSDHIELKNDALNNVVNSMNAKLGNTEWQTDLVEEEVKNLFILWLRIQKGFIEPPWFTDYLQFFHNLDEANYVKMLSYTEVQWQVDSTENMDIKPSSSSNKFNITEKDGRTKLFSSRIDCTGKTLEKERVPCIEIPCQLKLSKHTTIEQINYFIRLFKKHKLLWSYKHKEYLNKYEEILACSEIATQMAEKFPGVKFSPKNIMKRAHYLPVLHSNMISNKTPKLWFFDKLQFLTDDSNEKEIKASEFIWNAQNIIKGNPTETPVQTTSNSTNCEIAKENNVSLSTKESQEDTIVKEQKYALPLATDESSALIELFRDRPLLWNRKHVDYYKYPQRMALYKEIANIINDRFNLQHTPKDVQNKVFYLLRLYRRKTLSSHLKQQLKFLPKVVKPTYNCQYCELQFTKYRKCILHEYRHTHGQKYARKISKFVKCKQRIHGPDDSTSFLCNMCGKHLEKRDDYITHMFSEHLKKNPFFCSTCSSGFATRAQLEVHQRDHTGERPYHCSECHKTFATLPDIIRHRSRHTNVDPFICDKCINTCNTSHYIRNHSPLRKKQSGYICEDCGRTFTSKNYLHIHKITHSMTHRHACKMCGVSFKPNITGYSQKRKKYNWKSRGIMSV